MIMGKFKFVLVDDAKFMRSILKDIIGQNADYDVIAEGSDGYQAIELAELHKPDIITLDITMPNLDGIGAIREILKNSSKTKIIMVTALGQEYLIKEAYENGAKAYIRKPFNEKEVHDAISKVITER
jgi:two-component system chemotaxis response regulator CheY